MKNCCNNNGGAVYGIGLKGAVGVLKAFAWPALFVYKALELLNFNKLREGT